MQEPESFYPTDPSAWRLWLEENHRTKDGIWIIYFKKATGIPSVSWSQAVEEALCFGWIDSKMKSLDAQRFTQFFSKRKPKSVWSKVNKTKVERLIAQGLMSEAGFESIEIARQNGSWTSLDEVEALIVPADLEAGFESRPGSKAFYQTLSPSTQKSILQWLVLARRPETRQKRIEAVVDQAVQGLKPRQFWQTRPKKE